MPQKSFLAKNEYFKQHFVMRRRAADDTGTRDPGEEHMRGAGMDRG